MSARFVKRSPMHPHAIDHVVSVVLDVHVEPGDSAATISGPGQHPLFDVLTEWAEGRGVPKASFDIETPLFALRRCRVSLLSGESVSAVDFKERD